MGNKDDLIKKLCRIPIPTNYTMRELDRLMGKCGCSKFSGGRGSSVGYIHERTKRILQFDAPHSRSELYRYHIKMIIQFLKDIGEID